MIMCGLVVSFLLASTAWAQNYEPIRVDFGLTGGYASGISEGGFGGLVEPKYLPDDHLTLGLRIEGMVTFGASVGGDSNSFSTGSIGMIGAKAEYLVGDYAIRPVAGIGAGLHAIGGDTIGTGDDQVIVAHKSGSYYGLSPSVGIDLGRVRLGATYHYMFGADVEVEQTVGTSTTRHDFSQNYFTFELSFHVGGSRLEPAPPLTPTSAR